MIRSIAMVLLLSVFAQANAQQADKPSESSKEKSDNNVLLEGLLDLVKEPESPPAPGVPPVRDSEAGNAPGLRPEDVGLAGEDLKEQSDNPLQAVRQSMLIASGFLQRGATDEETQVLQNDIVLRLDRLISEFESGKQNSKSQQNESQGQTAGESEGTSERVSQQTTEMKSGDTGERSDTEIQKEPQATPGNAGKSPDAEVLLADPRALQLNAWGSLPDSVRAQMQSQMVERFLPSYREQIEAYFKTLLKQKSK